MTSLPAGRSTLRAAPAGTQRGSSPPVTTVGIDATPAMLDVARARTPNAEFREGDFTNLPFDDATFDLAVCALALAHLADPTPAIAEIARVVRPGGRVVLTDAHPTFVMIQGQAMFPTPGGLAFVRNHPVALRTYLAAFRASGLTVLDCLEEPLDMDFSRSVRGGSTRRSVLGRSTGLLAWSLEKAA